MSLSPVPRTFIIHLEERPGAIHRVLSALRRRAYGVGSLTVARTERPGVLRLTVAVEADERESRLLEANLYKLINVLYVEDVTRQGSVVRELVLIKVRVDEETRSQVVQACKEFQACTLDVTHSSLVVELTATPDRVDRLIEVLRPHGIVELARAGGVAMARGAQARLTTLLEEDADSSEWAA